MMANRMQKGGALTLRKARTVPYARRPDWLIPVKVVLLAEGARLDVQGSARTAKLVAIMDIHALDIRARVNRQQ
jgi:hypothetical protein